MLFNSFEFLVIFLPICILLFGFSAKRWGNEVAIAVLVICSLTFYAYWNPYYLVIIILSMLVNFWFGVKLGRHRLKGLLILGVVLNLALLGYYKYAGFLVFNLNMLAGTDWNIGQIVLPLAISFFTFQQIAYLVDSYKGITKEYSFLHYALFVSFFPQLIAGPIVHHKEMLPQFESTTRYRIDPTNLAIGLSIFAIGFFKKTVLADGVALYANPVFAAVDNGQSVDFFTAWGGALAYTLQLYFDFSGYSDMAIGLARIFGIVLPLNFYSPYKSGNISEFWRRWHMTLSRFLRDYVYIPLGGNRSGSFKRYRNLMATMLLGGLWHGAGWNFVLWGAIHGLSLAIHQVWVKLLDKIGFIWRNNIGYKVFAWMTTFLVVIFGWVFFRAVTFDGALTMLHAMSGFDGISLPNAILSRLGSVGELIQSIGVSSNRSSGSVFLWTWVWIAALLPAVLILPNTQDLFAKAQFSLSEFNRETTNTFWPLFNLTSKMVWKQSQKWACICACAMALGLLTLTQVSEFLYFQF